MNDFPQDPKRGIQVTMMLADHVDARQGLTIINGGSNVTGPNAPHSLALSFLVPPHLADEAHTFRLELIDLDGNGVGIQGNREPFVFEAQFDVQRPEGAPSDWTIPVSAGINLGPLGLPPHQTYEWRLMVDDKTHEDWRLVFHTIPPIQGQQRRAA
jgi:hypothetical protein